MNDDQILFARQDNVCFFKFVGDIRHNISGGLDSLINELYQGDTPTCQDVVVDLSQTRYLDSTNLGLLAMIARHQLKTTGHKPTLISTQGDVTSLLTSMCLDKVFVIVTDKKGETQQYQELDAPIADEIQRSKMILSAHQQLLELGEANRKAFQPVVDLMTQELQGRGEQ